MTCDFPYHVANLVLFLKRWTSFLKKFRLSVSHSVVSDCNLTDCSLSSSSRKFFLWRFSIGNSPTKNPGADCHSLLQGIVPKQGSNLGLLHCKQILYHPSHHGSAHTLYIAGSKEVGRDLPGSSVAKTLLPMQSAWVQSLLRELDTTWCN